MTDLPDLEPEETKGWELPTDLPESLHSPAIGGKSPYSPEIRARACLLATVYGSCSRAGKELGVPHRTVSDWSRTDWWAEIEAKLKQNAAKSLEARFTNLIAKSLQVLEDRLERGDPKLGAGGVVNRQGISAKDAALIQCQLFDKRALLRGDPTSRTERTSTAKDRLKGLAKQMERVAATPMAGSTPKSLVEPTDTVKQAVKH